MTKFAELDDNYELTQEDRLLIFEAAVTMIIKEDGENYILEELASAWNGIARAAENPPEEVKIAMELAGIEPEDPGTVH